MTASKCISELARSQPPSVSPDSLDYGIQVRTKMACKFISKLAPLRPPSSHDHGFPSTSSNSLDHTLGVHFQRRTITDAQVNLQTRTITASKCAEWWPPSVRPNSVDHGIGVHLKTRSITLWWNAGASRPSSHHYHSAAPRMASEENSWKTAFLAPGAYEECGRIWTDSRHDEPHELLGSIKPWLECMRRRAGKDRVCIAYN